MIKAFDKNNVELFHEELLELAKQLAAKHGIDVVTSSARYSQDQFSKKLTFKTKKSDYQGNEIQQDAATYLSKCNMYSLKPEWLNKSFAYSNGITYKIVGLKDRRCKKPVIVENAEGKQFVMSVETAKFYMRGH